MLKLIGDAATEAEVKAAAPDHRFSFGIDLHLGELISGNVGSPTRFDFTVMGQAVDLTARIEKLSRPLARPIILSEALARSCSRPDDDLGEHDVAGWDAPVRSSRRRRRPRAGTRPVLRRYRRKTR